MARIVSVSKPSSKKSEKPSKLKLEAPSKEKEQKKEQKKMSKSPHRGRTTNLRLKQCWAKVFEDNAKAQTSKRSTDEQLLKLMKSEFPDKKARTLRDVGGVAVARKRFNAGKFTKGVAPNVPSTAYDENGKATDSKSSRKKDGDEEGRRRGFHGTKGKRKGRAVRK